jgi:GNAT superfamily N-acetyltransferase
VNPQDNLMPPSLAAVLGIGVSKINSKKRGKKYSRVGRETVHFVSLLPTWISHTHTGTYQYLSGITSMAVDPRYQRQGISALLEIFWSLRG